MYDAGFLTLQDAGGVSVNTVESNAKPERRSFSVWLNPDNACLADCYRALEARSITSKSCGVEVEIESL